MAKAMGDETVLPIILRAMHGVYTFSKFGNETFSQLAWYCMSFA